MTSRADAISVGAKRFEDHVKVKQRVFVRVSVRVCCACVCDWKASEMFFFAVGGNFIAHVCWGFRMWYCSPSNGFWHYQIFWWLCSLFIVFSDSFISCASYSKRSGACQGFLLSSFAATAKVIAMVKMVLVRKFVIVLITVTAVRDCMARASFVVTFMSKSYGLG